MISFLRANDAPHHISLYMQPVAAGVRSGVTPLKPRDFPGLKPKKQQREVTGWQSACLSSTAIMASASSTVYHFLSFGPTASSASQPSSICSPG